MNYNFFFYHFSSHHNLIKLGSEINEDFFIFILFLFIFLKSESNQSTVGNKNNNN